MMPPKPAYPSELREGYDVGFPDVGFPFWDDICDPIVADVAARLGVPIDDLWEEEGGGYSLADRYFEDVREAIQSSSAYRARMVVQEEYQRELESWYARRDDIIGSATGGLDETTVKELAEWKLSELSVSDGVLTGEGRDFTGVWKNGAWEMRQIQNWSQSDGGAGYGSHSPEW